MALPNVLLAGGNKDWMHQDGLAELSRDKGCQGHDVIHFPKGLFSLVNGRVIFFCFISFYLTLIKLLTKGCVLEGGNGNFQRKGRDLKPKLQWFFSNKVQTVFSNVH